MLSLLGMLSFANAEETQATPEVWVQCNPMSGLMELEQLLPESYRETTKGLGNLGVGGFKKLGGDPNGTLLAAGSEGLTMTIPFIGNADTVGELLGVLQPESIVWQTGPKKWALELVDDHWVATLKEGALELKSISTTEEISAPSVLSGLSNIQEMNGCWLMATSDMIIPKTNIPLDGGVFVPFEDEPFSIFLRPDSPLPNFLEATGATPLEIRTPNAPAIVLSLGFDWAEFFADPVVQAKIGLSEAAATKISKRLRMQPGGMIAFDTVNIRKDPKISVALELHNRFGKAQSVWLIKRGIYRSLKQSGLEYDTLESNIISFVNNGQVLYLGVDKGRLYAGNTKLAIENMLSGEGEAWASEDFVSFAQTQPIALRVKVPQMVGMMAGGLESADIGIGKVEEYAQLTAHVNMTHDDGWTGLMPFIAGQLPDASPGQSIEEGQRIVQQLAAKEHMVFAETGSYVDVGQTGIFDNPDITIPGDILDLAPVTTSASKLGWMEQPTNGLYWVETTTDTFLVHGIFPFNGRLVHYTKSQLGQITSVGLDF